VIIRASFDPERLKPDPRFEPTDEDVARRFDPTLLDPTLCSPSERRLPPEGPMTGGEGIVIGFVAGLTAFGVMILIFLAL
jgi:hypothetical protein